VNIPQSIYTVQWVKLLDKTLLPDDDKLFDLSNHSFCVHSLFASVHSS